MRICGALLLTTLLGAATESDLRTTPFISGTDGYFCYRAPAGVVTKRGTVLAFSEGRVRSLE